MRPKNEGATNARGKKISKQCNKCNDRNVHKNITEARGGKPNTTLRRHRILILVRLPGGDDDQIEIGVSWVDRRGKHSKRLEQYEQFMEVRKLYIQEGISLLLNIKIRGTDGL